MNYYNPVKISFDTDSIDEINKLSENKKRLILCYDGFEKTELFKKISRKGNNDLVNSDAEENPSVESIDKALKEVKSFSPEVIIAIGGGSVIDTAKVVRYGLYFNRFSVKEMLDGGATRIAGDKPLFIAVPTTHGTGSEVTMWATVWDKIENRKYSVSDIQNYPDHAVYDHRLFTTLPLHVSVSSTLDALSHSFEALWNRNSNPVSDHFAFESIKLIIKNIDSLNDIVPDQARKELILASMYAGLAFSNTKTAAAHSISYPLTLKYGIPHGIACSMPLFPLLKINKKGMGNKLNRLFMNCEVKGPEELEKKIRSAVRGKVPFSLTEFGVKEDELDGLVDLCFTKERMANNIVELDGNDVRTVLGAIYD
ncbi:MAG: phosphonoacetaldehyde reductase [Acidobacteriota bacterium]